MHAKMILILIVFTAAILPGAFCQMERVDSIFTSMKTAYFNAFPPLLTDLIAGIIKFIVSLLNFLWTSFLLMWNFLCWLCSYIWSLFQCLISLFTFLLDVLCLILDAITFGAKIFQH